MTRVKEGYTKAWTLALESAAAKAISQEEERKAKQELEKEKSCANALAIDVDQLKKTLLEKEGAVTAAGKLIEDLQVVDTSNTT